MPVKKKVAAKKPRTPKRPPSAKVGEIVRVDFLDHSEHQNNPGQSAIAFKVYGVVSYIDAVEMRLVNWGYIGDDKTDGDGNEHAYSIVRATIFKLHKLGMDPE